MVQDSAELALGVSAALTEHETAVVEADYWTVDFGYADGEETEVRLVGTKPDQAACAGLRVARLMVGPLGGGREEHLTSQSRTVAFERSASAEGELGWAGCLRY